METGLVDSESCGGVSLRIQIDEQGRVTREGQAGCEIDRGRRLADPAFLVNDRDCSGYIPTAAVFLMTDRRPIILRRGNRQSDSPAVFHVTHTGALR